jgi:RNA-binding protein Musashi
MGNFGGMGGAMGGAGMGGGGFDPNAMAMMYQNMMKSNMGGGTFLML